MPKISTDRLLRFVEFGVPQSMLILIATPLRDGAHLVSGLLFYLAFGGGVIGFLLAIYEYNARLRYASAFVNLAILLIIILLHSGPPPHSRPTNSASGVLSDHYVPQGLDPGIHSW